MLSIILSAIVILQPQAQSRPSQPERSLQPKVIGVTENGWPIFEEDGGKVDSRPAGRSDFETAPRPIKALLPVIDEDSSEEVSGDLSDLDPMRLDSPLREVFTRLGFPSDVRALGGVRAYYRLTLRSHNGAAIGVHEIEHHADLGYRARDLLKMASGEKTYGRDGAAVFANLDRMRMESYEAEARDELELLGLLLRFPWEFADGDRYAVEDKRFMTVAGRALVLIPIRARRPREGSMPGAQVDRFEILCAADSMEPKELRYTLASSGHARRLRLSHYRQVGGVRIPFRREFLNAVGSPGLIMEILTMDHGRDLPTSTFRPSQ